jgi:hypothetical protein
MHIIKVQPKNKGMIIMLEYNNMAALELGMSLFPPINAFWDSQRRKFREISSQKLIKEYKAGVYLAE